MVVCTALDAYPAQLSTMSYPMQLFMGAGLTTPWIWAGIVIFEDQSRRVLGRARVERLVQRWMGHHL
jgi:hypothetical protein